MPLVRVPPISITQDAGLQLVKVRPFKWMKMKGWWGGREGKKRERETAARRESNTKNEWGLEAAEHVRLLDIRSREGKGREEIFLFFFF